jgi:hypothetical protein
VVRTGEKALHAFLKGAASGNKGLLVETHQVYMASMAAGARWALVVSLDDFSRKILYADFFEQETTWAHIRAAEALMRTYGIPLRYCWLQDRA